ncbi:MAG TPA: hypothetical protein VGS14_08515 [Actinomycetes bacterium]|nr:hypothetical protein [Actinomycetes bacterium]
MSPTHREGRHTPPGPPRAVDGRRPPGAGRRGGARELEWLAEVLWGPNPGVEVVVGVPSSLGWGVLPDLRRPRVLVPLTSRRAAAGAVRQYSDGMTQRARLAKAAVGLGLRSGALQWWLRRRGLLVGAVGPPEGTLLGDHVAAALGRSDLAAAIALGPVRPNRKPVVQLIGRDGQPVGYMKVGWNDLTRRLVRAEADMLRRLAGAGPRSFTAPGLLHQGQWQGLEITISSALPHRLWRRGRRYAMPPPAVSREIAALGGVEVMALGESPWWAGLRRRLAPIRQALDVGPAGTHTDGRDAAALDATIEALEGQAATRLAFATWHGDWGPWNLRSTPDRLLVWDWERSGDGVPLGFDLLHFGYQTALQGLGQPPAAAAATGRDRAAPRLAELGQQTGVEELLLTLYLLERLCRAAEAEVSAVTGRPDTVGAALLEVLGRRLRQRGTG